MVPGSIRIREILTMFAYESCACLLISTLLTPPATLTPRITLHFEFIPHCSEIYMQSIGHNRTERRNLYVSTGKSCWKLISNLLKCDDGARSSPAHLRRAHGSYLSTERCETKEEEASDDEDLIHFTMMLCRLENVDLFFTLLRFSHNRSSREMRRDHRKSKQQGNEQIMRESSCRKVLLVFSSSNIATEIAPFTARHLHTRGHRKFSHSGPTMHCWQLKSEKMDLNCSLCSLKRWTGEPNKSTTIFLWEKKSPWMLALAGRRGGGLRGSDVNLSLALASGKKSQVLARVWSFLNEDSWKSSPRAIGKWCRTMVMAQCSQRKILKEANSTCISLEAG